MIEIGDKVKIPVLIPQGLVGDGGYELNHFGSITDDFGPPTNLEWREAVVVAIRSTKYKNSEKNEYLVGLIVGMHKHVWVPEDRIRND